MRGLEERYPYTSSLLGRTRPGGPYMYSSHETEANLDAAHAAHAAHAAQRRECMYAKSNNGRKSKTKSRRKHSRGVERRLTLKSIRPWAPLFVAGNESTLVSSQPGGAAGRGGGVGAHQTEQDQRRWGSSSVVPSGPSPLQRINVSIIYRWPSSLLRRRLPIE